MLYTDCTFFFLIIIIERENKSNTLSVIIVDVGKSNMYTYAKRVQIISGLLKTKPHAFRDHVR